MSETLLSLSYAPNVFREAVSTAPAPPSTFLAGNRPPIRVESTLGKIAILPVESLHEILGHCSIYTLVTFRLVCENSKRLVDTLLPYGRLVVAAPALLATLLRTKCATFFTAYDVYHVLTNPACFSCGRFGAFMYLVECARCCAWCLRYSPKTMPMTLAEAKSVFKLTDKQLANGQIPVVSSLPGRRVIRVGGRERDYKTVKLVSGDHARLFALFTHGNEQALAELIASGTSRTHENYRQRQHAKALLTDQNTEAYVRNNPTREHRYRFLASTHLPYVPAFNPTPTIEWGVCCQGCQDAFANALAADTLRGDRGWALTRRRDTEYTVAEFLQHVTTCPETQTKLQNSQITKAGD
ncbi:hypothetical protein PHLGIDRAFT_160143 [Phlebiopsis gigantea 11061_1 CR5-6]|uniref:F-box domain-containing protein n=1 Tax=Phlebiopsis gigantea (strain 11061_1 CR5-6) TaxID=745531 RepID=A0A0C3S5E8_PHLG1|nr:hypothetical protein PHLGIDRAFT_160143 [Phlebiopsis gigantea 11061_1 CR5-6]